MTTKKRHMNYSSIGISEILRISGYQSDFSDNNIKNGEATRLKSAQLRTMVD
jgi:hypothetical protein